MSRAQYSLFSSSRQVRIYSGAALVLSPISSGYPVTNESKGSMVASLFVGRCTVAGTTLFALQDSMGYGVWSAAKATTAAITSSTNTAATVTAGASAITVTAHGLATGRHVVVGGTVVPAELATTPTYVVEVVNANSIRLLSPTSSAYVVPTTTGTSVTITAVREFRIILNANDPALYVANVPLANELRACLTKAVDDSVQVIDFLISG